MRKTTPGDVDLKVELLGMQLENPIVLASGILGETGYLLLSAHQAGAGAVTTKSIGLEPKDGHKNPTIHQTQNGMLNAMGLPNPGIDEFEKEMKLLKGSGAVVIGSIFASRSSDFAILAQKMEKYGASAIELNLSCPHARGYGAEIGSSPSSVRKITKTVVDSVSIPVLAKLTPNTSDICSLGLAAQEGGAGAVVAINTIKAMEIDPYIRKPVLGNKFGGLSGSAIKPIGVRCVYELYSSLSIPIIGAGGITTGVAVAEYVMAGATAVQVGTVIQSRGLEAFSKLQEELKEFMRSESIRRLTEIRGIAHEQ